MRELSEPNYERAINKVATAIEELGKQHRIQNLLYIQDQHHLSDELRQRALEQAKALLRLK